MLKNAILGNKRVTSPFSQSNPRCPSLGSDKRRAPRTNLCEETGSECFHSVGPIIAIVQRFLQKKASSSVINRCYHRNRKHVFLGLGLLIANNTKCSRLNANKLGQSSDSSSFREGSEGFMNYSFGSGEDAKVSKDDSVDSTDVLSPVRPPPWLPHNGYSDFESAGQNSVAHKPTSRWAASEDERSSYPYAQAGPLDLDAWPESDAVSLSRQIFGGKSSGELFAFIFPDGRHVVLQL
ncbi:hypothetical protein CEXT_496801 [Caerostris extrusa]|uniref:Uncharacterized protein n=1 Tax=Caerostris extrusa TaxID=172846 RepID=A0AAV4MN07_CAEEX|nr:hypothetical protein CEXT_496801 [Caerostris extrusa]